MNRTLLAAATAAAALASPAAPAQEPAAPSARDADYHNRQLLYLYGLDPREGWRATPSGLRYRKVGGEARGPSPSPTDTVTIHYVGRLIDGHTDRVATARSDRARGIAPRAHVKTNSHRHPVGR